MIWALLSVLLAVVAVYKGRNRDFWFPLLLLFQASFMGPELPNLPPQDVPLNTLEDRADFQFGKSFDELSPEQQEFLLGEQRQSSTLFLPLAPGLKHPNLVPDLKYLAKLRRARRVALFGFLALVAAHFAVPLLPRLSILAACINQARPCFWCIFEGLLLPMLFLVWRGPWRLEAG